MKKTCLMLMLVMALLVNSVAGASGLLGNRGDGTNTPAGVDMISFGVTNGIEPASTGTLKDGGTQEVYYGVTNAQFNAFSNRLAEDGSYQVVNSYTNNGQDVYILEKNGLQMVVAYNESKGEFIQEYPVGAAIEKAKIPDPFTEYRRIEMGTTLKLKEGKITFSEFVMDRPYNYCYSYVQTGVYLVGTSSWGKETRGDPISRSTFWLNGKFQNTTSSELLYMKLFPPVRDVSTIGSAMTLHYISEDGNHYTYTNNYTSKFQNGNQLFVGRIGDNYKGPSILSDSTPRIGSMETGSWGLAFDDVPEAVYKARDGILALTFKLDGVDYVIYIRGGN